jgi:hypothetical protein
MHCLYCLHTPMPPLQYNYLNQLLLNNIYCM